MPDYRHDSSFTRLIDYFNSVFTGSRSKPRILLLEIAMVAMIYFGTDGPYVMISGSLLMEFDPYYWILHSLPNGLLNDVVVLIIRLVFLSVLLFLFRSGNLFVFLLGWGLFRNWLSLYYGYGCLLQLGQSC